jgi:hypothetical protein
VETRFWAFVDRSGTCWEWQGSKSRGYGRFKVSRRMVQAHRFAYELMVGPIPEGLTLDHLCRNTSCVNPEHLEPATERDNILRSDGPAAINARRVECVRGHRFDQANTAVFTRPNGTTYRQCRACCRLRNRGEARQTDR